MKSLLRLVQALLKDLQRLNPNVTGLDRDLVTVEARCEHEGVSFLTCALPSFGQWFDRSLASGRVTCLEGFSFQGQIPKFLKGIVCNVFDNNTGLLKDDADVGCIKSIRELCYFFKKLTPTDSRQEVLEKRTVREFVETDQQVMLLDSFDSSLVEQLERISRLVLPKLDQFQELDCRHGPGAVAEGFSANQKWSALTSSIVDGSLSIPGYDLVSSLRQDEHGTKSSFKKLSDASLICVPKTQTALRTITVEPMLNQFYQQGLNKLLRDEICKCPVLSHSLDLTDQSKNQQLAIDGSIDGEWTTVDLSRASDLLSIDLVKLVFRSKPRFLEALLESRTPTVKVQGKTLLLNKYAGMGNATTFPVQSVVFALLAIAAGMEGMKLSYRNATRVAKQVRVFGDDIIVRTPIYVRLKKWITSFGLRINQKKTFTDGFFRESCGVDCYRGFNVTPIYLHRNPRFASKDPCSLASTVSTSNQVWLAGRYSLAQELQRYCGKLPLVPSDSGALGWHTRQDLTTISRWNSNLHRFEFRSVVLCAKRRKDHLDGMPALIKYFLMPGISEYDKEHLISSPIRFDIMKRTKWLASR